VSVPHDARTRRRQETHRRIYGCAMRLFQERGYDEVTVAHIVAAAGVSVPTFYDHFPSKEHIVLPMPEPGEIEKVLLTVGEGLTIAERLRRGIVSWLASYQGQEREALLDRWRIVVRTPGLRTRAASFERATAEMVLGMVSVEESTTALPDVVVAASLSAYTQILLRWAEADGRVPLEEVAERVLAALREL
jgi:AcrR family transcriptional regulator